MPTRRGIEARVGDVLELPLGPGLVGYAQLVAMAPYGDLYVVVFRSLHREDARPTATSVVRDDIAFVGNTLDGHIRDGLWPVVGNVLPDLDRVPFPAYKLMKAPPNQWAIESFDRSSSRPATPVEVEPLDYRETVSPAILEHALAKLHGLRTEGDYTSVEYGRVMRLAALTNSEFQGPAPRPEPTAEPTTDANSDEAVFLHLPLQGGFYGSADEREEVRELARSLEHAIQTHAAGSFDGDEWGGDECVLRFYAADADAILASIRQSLRGNPVAGRAYAIVRRGSVDDTSARNERVSLIEH